MSKYFMPGPVDPRKLRTLIAQAGYTHAEFAAEVHVDAMTVSRWTNGRTTILPSRRQTILEICAALGRRFGREVLPEELAKGRKVVR